jgi:BioD-like phosphotransacetylase family protein
MKTLCISSSSDFAGKNLLLVGLGYKIKQSGYELSFFKPIGNKPHRFERTMTDADIVFFHQHLGLPIQPTVNCPVLITDALVDSSLALNGKEGVKKELYNRVRNAFNTLSETKDVVLVKGLGRFYRGGIFGLTEISLIKDFNWHTIIIDKFTSLGESVDNFIGVKKVLGNLLVGVVFNAVPLAKINAIKTKAIPYLKNEDIPVLGIVPEDRALDAVSLEEIRDSLQGELITRKDKLDNMVERFCMGVANVESSLALFRKEKCQAVVTSGDRSDIQLAALEMPLKCLILTDKLYPSDIILSRAEELKVPVLVVPHDIIRTMNKLNALTKHVGLATPSKVKGAIRAVASHINTKIIYKRLKL